MTRSLERQLPRSRSRYLAVVDAGGRTLATAGRPPDRLALGAAARGGLALSDVVDTGGAPGIEYAVPFGAPEARRALVQHVPLPIMAAFLGDYLAQVRDVDASGVALTDRRGRVISSRGDVDASDAPGEDRVHATAVVPGTPWTLRLEADRSRVYADDGGRWLAWLLLVALGLATLAGLRLQARALASVHRQREANLALRESREQAGELVEALEEGVVLHHADGRTELLNASARELLGTDVDVMDGRDADWQLLDEAGEPLADEDAPVSQVLATGAGRTQTVALRREDGSRQWLTVRARPLVRPGEQRPHAVVASITDVTEQREMERHLTDLAQRDPLTGLFNRRRFEGDLAQQLARCRRYDEIAVLLVLDLDGFKQVNDTHGHLAGDEVLRALATGLSRRRRAGDSVGRIGGDEFAVLLVEADAEGARAMVREVAEQLMDVARDALHADAELSLSVGLAILDRATGGVAEAFAVADREMYADKRRQGRPPAGEPADAGSAAAAALPGGRDLAHVPALRALLTAVQARDASTAEHSREVVTLARAVARRLGLHADVVAEVESVALLHDLGKIAIPDAILRKAGPLNEHEWLLMRQHPVVGAQMVASIPELEHLAPAVGAEHERWDGAGYPAGLTGDAIPVSSRIAFVCDAFHAMTNDRPYRRALSHEAAVAEIAAEAGRQFCPAAARALLDVLAAPPVGADRQPVAADAQA